MIEALLVLLAGVAPALARHHSRRHAVEAGSGRDAVATVRRHRAFLDGLAAATGTTDVATTGP